MFISERSRPCKWGCCSQKPEPRRQEEEPRALATKRWPRLVKAGLLEAKWHKRCPGWLSCPPEARETRDGMCLPTAPRGPSWKQLLLGQAAGAEIRENRGETQGREKDAIKMRWQCKGQSWERSFFFFFLGLFVLEILVTNNSKVILKTYWALCGNRCPQLWFSFPLFHPPYPN